jgi:hypothetical protein
MAWQVSNMDTASIQGELPSAAKQLRMRPIDMAHRPLPVIKRLNYYLIENLETAEDL